MEIDHDIARLQSINPGLRDWNISRNTISFSKLCKLQSINPGLRDWNNLRGRGIGAPFLLQSINPGLRDWNPISTPTTLQVNSRCNQLIPVYGTETPFRMAASFAIFSCCNQLIPVYGTETSFHNFETHKLKSCNQLIPVYGTETFRCRRCRWWFRWLQSINPGLRDWNLLQVRVALGQARLQSINPGLRDWNPYSISIPPL